MIYFQSFTTFRYKNLKNSDYLTSLRVADDLLSIVNLSFLSVLAIGHMTHLAHRFTALGDFFLLTDTLHIVVDGAFSDVRKIIKVFLQMVKYLRT